MDLHLRSATMADARLLLDWRNDPATRANSFSRDEVPWAAHVAWLERKLAAPGTRIWIGEQDGVPVGQVRYDRMGDVPEAVGNVEETESAEVSIVVAPAARGRGVGTALLVASSGTACRELGIRRLVGRIKRANAASVRAFEKAGYRVVGETVYRGQRCLEVYRPVG